MVGMLQQTPDFASVALPALNRLTLAGQLSDKQVNNWTQLSAPTACIIVLCLRELTFGSDVVHVVSTCLLW